MASSDDWLNRKRASEYLVGLGCACSVKTLENFAINDNADGGPPFTRYRRSTVRYKRSDLDAWAAKQLRRIE